MKVTKVEIEDNKGGACPRFSASLLLHQSCAAILSFLSNSLCLCPEPKGQPLILQSRTKNSAMNGQGIAVEYPSFHSFIHSFMHAFIHSLIHSLNH